MSSGQIRCALDVTGRELMRLRTWAMIVGLVTSNVPVSTLFAVGRG